ncbi:MAG TPA: amino acid adenylation domain-containing protein, partial [Thermoanaerobaculia bacterium]|nr:amino acid adenylation domain-containing protein [Thermoanaerobaculia bacterium]
MIDQETRIAALSPEKRLLLALLSKRRPGAAVLPRRTAAAPLGGAFSLISAEDRRGVPEGVEDAYPLASMQLGMLYHTALTRNDPIPAYHNVFLFDLERPLAPGVFGEALQHLASRHAIFRTSFDLTSFAEPLQLVHRRVDFPLHCIDLEGLAPRDQEHELDRFLHRERRRVHDIGKPPLLRFQLHRCSGGRSRLTMTESHTVAEGWGTYQTLGELYDIYSTLLRGEQLPVRGTSQVLYRDFIRLEQEALKSPVHRRFWAEKLAAATLAKLPHWPGSQLATAPRRFRSLDVPAATIDRLLAVARRLEIPLKSVLLAVHLKLLSAASGQSDLTVALHVHGRPETLGGEYVRGVFNNTVPLRVRLLPGTWAELIAATFAAELELMPYQRYPWAALQQDGFNVAQLEVQIGYTHFHLFGEFAPPPGVTVPPARVRRSVGHFPLILYFSAYGSGPDSLLWLLEVGDPQVTEVQIESLLASCRSVLGAIGEDVDARHEAWSPLSPAERHQLLVEWNDSGPAGGDERCLDELMACQAVRTPERIAVVCGEHALSYGELARRSRGLAEELWARGVGPEVRVAVCRQRSLEMVVSLLGVLAAGGAYVPVDPSYPRERQDYILDDAQVQFCLTDAGIAERRPAGRRAGSSALTAEPGNLAYVIYTSGSTGRPKGVAVTHQNVVALLRWAEELFSADELAGVLASTSICFDLSAFELFVPLSRGGRVILARDALELPELPARDLVRLINTVPSVMAELVRVGAIGAGVRTANVAGEPLPRSLAEAIYGIAGIERVWNLYGPSEDTTYSTFALVERGAGGAPAIGRAIAGSWAYVLNPDLQPVPVGVTGELYLGGAGLARGYLGRPELTGERFVPDPWSGRSGSRLYRTGDLARWLPGGELEFLGRIDHQVKVRGFRVELGEIEAALAAHAAVREAVVVVREAAGDRRLVAYVVAREGQDAGGARLRSFLGQTLPAYMVPSSFVALAALPLTPSGKVDRKALPEAGGKAGERAAFVAPRTPGEGVLAAIWEEVLGVERVGLDDGFFDLGGHSLVAMRMISRITGALGVELPVRTLFEHPKLIDLAAAVERAGRAKAGTERGAPRALPAEERLALSFAQQRLWFIDRLEPGSAAYNLPIPVHIAGALEVAAFAAAAGEIVRRHEVLRTRFEARGGEAVQRVMPPSPLPLPVVDLSGLEAVAREATMLRLVAADARRPFDLARGPMLRCRLLRLDRQQHVASLALHHIASDGWSMGVLVREATALYAAFAGGAASPLAELPIQYADYAARQRQWLQGEVLEGLLAYWRQRLSGLPAALELPVDRPRRPLPGSRAGRRRLSVAPETLETLRRLGRNEGATPFMTMLASFEALLGRFSGQRDLAVGTPVAGRGQVELEALIGCFVNTLVLRGELAGDPSFRELLGRVREGSLEAYAHQELPFERLVEELKVERSLIHSPLFQVMFVLDPPAEAETAGGGLRWRSVDAGAGTAQFDITLSLAELGGGLVGSLEYREELFDAATVERLAGKFVSLLGALARSPESPLSAHAGLGAAERHQVLHEWSGEWRRDAAGGCLDELLAAAAARTPDRIAVASGEAVLSYGELDRRANQMAWHLVRCGAGPEVVVALCCERSPQAIVALLGILKAGSAYLPCEPALPAARLGYLLGDSGAAMVVTEERLAEKLAGLTAGPVICLDRDGPRIARQSTAAPAGAAAGSQRAYLMYTSGSTGAPKGVEVEHAAVRSFVESALALYGPVVEDRVLQFASLAFDISVEEIFTTLAAGATLVLRPAGVAGGAAELLAFCREQSVTALDLPTAYWHELVTGLAQGGLELAPAVRLVIIGGEEALGARLAEWRSAVGQGVRLVNTYGPTEATVVALAQEPRAWEARISLGRPLANARVYVLDAELEPVPVGVGGELCVGGEGVARGYLGRPELTGERFVPDPWSGRSGSRLYRTGDRARWLTGGELEFLGRIDHQVKVRGFRVELGEIEAALAAHATVREAAVVVREAAGHRRLVAYVVARESEGASGAQLKSFLGQMLPAYMVPSSFVALAALPLTAGGKLDRKALAELAEPDREGQPGERRQAPRTATEKVLAAIWEEILGVPRVGLEDGFFDLGGHSLVAMRMISRI